MRISFVSKSFASESGVVRKGRLLTGVASVAGLLGFFPGAVSAQDIAGTPAAEEAAPIVVTGSRIVRDGNDAPTPVSVISAQEIANEAPANIADFVNTLPSVSGSQTAVSNSGSLSNGASGVSALNLRSLGQNRTLILIDGKRSVASTSTGLVDVNTIPQSLIERVEVVTGGASSAYGSDAVAGVVNFVLDKDFSGIKADYEHGVTTYGDIPNHKMSLTAGTSFADGRGHVIVSGEYFTQKGVHSIDRDWNDNGVFQINNPNRAAGQPERIIVSGAGSSNFTPGGLITGCRNAGGAVAGCSLTGTYFGEIGANGIPSINELAYGQVSGQWMVGGDYRVTSANHASSNSLANDEDRISLFGRASFEVADWLTVFGQASYNTFKGYSIYQQTPSVGVAIAVDNAFLPTEIRDQMVAQGLTSITMGTSNAGITGSGADTEREVQRYVVGAEGSFNALGTSWDWDVYYQHGKTKTRETLTDTWFNPRMAAMQDAVFDANGNIVCRVNNDPSTTNDLPGCVPINRIGIGGITQEAKDFLFAIRPEREQYIGQDVAGFNFSTPRLFEGWAGPIALAFGAEYREEAVDGYTDANQYFDTPGQTWLYGNFRVTNGSYNVKEAYAETLVPLYDGLEFNGAFRVTDYSISGTVTTWKAGLTYQPIEDIRFRGTISRDIRAPNLSELFDPGTARTNSVNVPDAEGNPRPEEFIQNFTGSLLLTPEIAKTYGAGIVFTPTFLDGFTAAVDYFDIKVSDSIGSISAQTTADLCFEQNIQEYCDNIRYAEGSTTDITFIDLTNINFASQHVKGLDLEAGYRMALGAGKLSLRALATYYFKNVTDTGIDRPNDAAGTLSLPKLTYRAQVGYAFDSGFELNMIGRGFSDMVYDNDYIECTTGCPATDPINRTISENDIKGSLYFDLNANYNFEVGPTKARVFLAVRNLFDRDPVLTGNGPDGNNTPAYPQTSRGNFDTFGRVFRLGLSVQY